MQTEKYLSNQSRKKNHVLYGLMTLGFMVVLIVVLVAVQSSYKHLMKEYTDSETDLQKELSLIGGVLDTKRSHLSRASNRLEKLNQIDECEKYSLFFYLDKRIDGTFDMHENRLDQRIKKYKTMMELGREQLAETRKTNSSRIRQKSTIEKNKAKFSLFKGFMMTEMLQGAVQTIEADRTRVRGWVNQMVTKHHDLMNETTSYDDDIEATGTMGGLRRLYGRIGGESPGDFWLFVDHYIDGLLLLEQTMLYTKNVYITTIYRRLVAALRVMHGKYNVLLYMSGMTNVSGDDLIQFGGRIGMEIQNEYDRISIPKIDEEKWAQIVSGEK